MANWRIKIKSPIFYLANLFCTRLTQNLARDPSAVAVIQVEQSLKNTWRPCVQLIILSNSEHVFIIIYSDDGNAEKRQTRSGAQATNSRFYLCKTSKEHRSRLTDIIIIIAMELLKNYAGRKQTIDVSGLCRTQTCTRLDI